MYVIVYDKKALKDIPKLKAKKLDQKAKTLIELLRKDPFQSPPTFEKLQGDLFGAYSRRINVQHRVVCKLLTTCRGGSFLFKICSHISIGRLSPQSLRFM